MEIDNDGFMRVLLRQKGIVDRHQRAEDALTNLVNAPPALMAVATAARVEAEDTLNRLEALLPADA